LADAVERVSQHFGWTTPAIDRDLTGGSGTIANSQRGRYAAPSWE
jgi:hypothetical protein